MRIFLVTLLIILIVCHTTFAELPLPSTLGQPNETTSDGMQAIIDATRDVKQADLQVWTLIGCIGGVLGVTAAYAIPPSVPPIKLLGKSPEYITYYTQTYQQEIKSERTKQATIGCVAGWVFVGCFYALLLPEIY